MLNASAEQVERDLLQYGEEETAGWLMRCTEEELVRVCSVAEWLLYNGPRTSSGASMTIAKACALSAVYVREGAPRDLANSRRKKISGLPPVPSPGRRPDHRLQSQVPTDYGVGDDAREYWHSS